MCTSKSQIKSWCWSESGCRKKGLVNGRVIKKKGLVNRRVIEKGFTDLSQSIDIQDNEEGGHDKNEGVTDDQNEWELMNKNLT